MRINLTYILVGGLIYFLLFRKSTPMTLGDGGGGYANVVGANETKWA